MQPFHTYMGPRARPSSVSSRGSHADQVDRIHRASSFDAGVSRGGRGQDRCQLQVGRRQQGSPRPSLYAGESNFAFAFGGDDEGHNTHATPIPINAGHGEVADEGPLGDHPLCTVCGEEILPGQPTFRILEQRKSVREFILLP